MAVDYFGRDFPFGKFKFFARAELVCDLAGDFNFSRSVHDEEKKRQ